MGIEFVTPDTVRLPISDGQSIQIKKRLTHGEREAMYKFVRESGSSLWTVEVVAYLLSWSSAAPYAMSMTEQERLDIIKNLDWDSFDEIQSAIKAHVEALAEEKKLRNGAALSLIPLPSVASTSGPMSMSEASPQMSTT